MYHHFYRYVPESVLKKRKVAEDRSQRIAKREAKAHKITAFKRKVQFKRAEKYVAEYRDTERSLIQQRRDAKKKGVFFVEPEAKVAFVVRIRGIMGVAPKVKKILQLLRLRQIQNGVFVKVNKATMQMLNMVSPYVAYGYPNLKTIRELIYKRGFAKIGTNRIPLADNTMIEKHLGHLNIICMEDLIHEIYTCGKSFKQANKFLWPFKLSSPLGGYKKKLLNFAEGGDSGNREEHINAFAQRMI